MSILGFKTNLVGGGARPNQFEVQLDFPRVANDGMAIANKGRFLCTATSLPDSTIGTAMVYYRGRPIPLAGDRQFNPWTVTILNDTDFQIRNQFEKWMSAMGNYTAIGGVTAPFEYTANPIVRQLGRNGMVLKEYQMRDAWVSNVSPIQLAFGQNDQVEEFQVTFMFTDFNPFLTPNSPGMALADAYSTGSYIGDAGEANADR